MPIFWIVVAFSVALPPLVQSTWGYYQDFAVEPQNTEVIIGESVVLPCQVSHKKGRVYWNKYGEIISMERNTFGIKRYSIIGSDSDGNYSLKIDPVEELDDGEYHCSITAVKLANLDLHSRKVWLKVLIAPKPPFIVAADHFYAVEYRPTQLECVSESGNPPANIVWLDNQNFTITDNVIQTYKPDPYGITFTTKSILTFVPKYLDNDANYTCRAQNSAQKTYQSTTIRLHILYTPVVHLEIMSQVDSQGFAPLGSDVTVFCRAEGNPTKLTYSWYLDSFLVAENSSNELFIPKVDERYDNVIVKCCVKNSLGISSSFLHLRVKYGPKLRYISKEIQDIKGANVTLKCDAIGSPTPSFLWTHVDTSQIVGNESTLFIILDENTKGKYECTATISGEEPVRAEVEIILLNPPDIVSTVALQDDMGNAWLECVVSSLSALNKPENNVTWTYNGNIIDSLDKKNVIQETKYSNHTLKSILLIKNVQPENYGTYLCTASNSNGVTSTEILLQPATAVSQEIVVSIVISLLIAAILTFAYYLYRRCKKCLTYKINHTRTKNFIHRMTNEVDSNFMEDSVLSDAIDCISSKNSAGMNPTSTCASQHHKNERASYHDLF